MTKSKKTRTKARAKDWDLQTKSRSTILVDRIDLADRFEEECAQAIGIASLMMEADADVAIQNAAWAVRDLVEKIRNIGRIVLESTMDKCSDEP